MKNQKLNWLLAGIMAAIVTLTIRLTVYGDCNLLVVAMTFLLAFIVAYGAVWTIRRILPS